MSLAECSSTRRGLAKRFGVAALVVVLLAAVGLVPRAMVDLSWPALAVLLTALVMAALWLTEALPLAGTALIPLIAFPTLGVAPLDEIAPAYAHPLILLFLGGFLLARGIEAHMLHHRIATGILAAVGTRPTRIVAGLMLATAMLSMFISNTASTMVMAPIGAALAATREGDRSFGAAVMLGIAFSATIGGMASLTGTPPNAIFAAYMRDVHSVEIDFARWALVGVPTAAVLLPVCWLVLTRLSMRVNDDVLLDPVARRGPMQVAERRVACIAALTAILWITRPVIDELVPTLNLSDAGIAIGAAIALFAISDGRGGRLLNWAQAAGLRWDVLMLFGGGLALAQGIERTGLAVWIGDKAADLQSINTLLLVLMFAGLIVLIGELASNTAMAAIFLPIAGATSVGLGVDPVLFTLPIALAASIGFMLPVATPPNAIVFAHPAVSRQTMLRAGAWLDVAGTLVALAVASLVAPLVFAN